MLGLVKKKANNSSNLLFNLCLVLIIVFSANYLEEDLIIGTFSTIILILIYIYLKELISSKLREYRKKVKKIFRVQRDFLKRTYFTHNKISRLHFSYMKKIIFNHYSLKSLKLFLSFNLKIKNFISKKIYYKIFYFNLVILFIIKLNFKLFNLFNL